MTFKEAENQTSRFKVFHDLMRKKVDQVLLISTSYEAWIMEEDCRLSEHIVHEYKGLNLSRPPRLTWVSTTEQALECLDSSDFDLVIIISRAADAGACSIADDIKGKAPDMPVVLLTHQESLPDVTSPSRQRFASIDRTIFWTGNASLLVAIIKSVEDQLNVVHDTRCAGIRVILLVEDSPFYLSTLLPVLYKELVIETQAVMEEGLNEEHRLLAMRARPKILIANTFEEALNIYEHYKDFILGMISDVRFPRRGTLDARAGLDLLGYIRDDRFDIPLLLASSEPHNADLAADIPACFIDKNASVLNEKIRSFLMDYLGFGDFFFKLPDGGTITRATDLYTLEQKLKEIPEASFIFHCRRNDFSRWLYSLAEVDLASRVRDLREDEFHSTEDHRRHLIQLIKQQRIHRQKGVIVNFDADKFDPDTEFLKIGNGSIGGKARGLAFMSAMLYRQSSRWAAFESVDINVPQTVVITTEGFDAFLEINRLHDVAGQDLPDEDIAQRFMEATFPENIQPQLAALLKRIRGPIAVRSSSLLEDAPFKSYAGLYKTYLLPNDHEALNCRLAQLIDAVKMVYASTYYKAPRAFTRRVGNRVENEKMAVIVQRLVGRRHKEHFYPSISGVAQSENYYPFSKMRTEDGIASIALGLGKTVMEGEKNMRFSPRFPQILPQRSTVDDTLKNSQIQFYALKMGANECPLGINDAVTLSIRDIADALDEAPIRMLCSTYIPNERRIRDGFTSDGYPVLTFAPVLKYDILPLPDILAALLSFGRRELGCPVEIEFAVDLPENSMEKARFAVLQIRPMSAREEMLAVDVTEADRAHAFCISHRALGNTIHTGMADIVYVKPDRFDPSCTMEIAQQIAQINTRLVKENRKYVLIGPGRWGSADRWLGIPVGWVDISGAGAIVETVHPRIHADPSQGSHFFHNITTLGISYLNVGGGQGDHIDWPWLAALPVVEEKAHVVHAASPNPFTLKVDGRT
ncbi:PEP/pyruvate-binding domain-containing protein, partial [Desulfosarcina sp.]|uniref:PEP/pyruvate-binding domain-containing protein n=1 Tax=Desulfosarcina sp. TaxID=2027861 RepID=UPI0029AE826A